MDRTEVNIASSQVGFIDVIILPAFDTWSMFLPNAQVCVENAKSNQLRWKESIPQYQLRLEENRKNIEEQKKMVEDIKSAFSSGNDMHRILSFGQEHFETGHNMNIEKYSKMRSNRNSQACVLELHDVTDEKRASLLNEDPRNCVVNYVDNKVTTTRIRGGDKGHVSHH